MMRLGYAIELIVWGTKIYARKLRDTKNCTIIDHYWNAVDRMANVRR